MTKKVHYQKVTVPTLFITKGKQRVKQYDDIVYLNDGDEFELELFNPTQQKILAKIKLNNHEMSSGIIIRPGERVFLERYLDEAKKFIFDTYNVDGDDPNTKEAIKSNGTVEVNFHQQQSNWCNGSIKYISQPIGPYDCPPTNPYLTQPFYFSDTTGALNIDVNGSLTYSNSSNDSLTINTTGDLSFSKNASGSVCYYSYNCNNEIETGRVEKGSHSDQSFSYDNTEFYSWATWTSTWKILPTSRKVYKKEDLVVYCTNCGQKRRKDSHKFCPSCGTKF